MFEEMNATLASADADDGYVAYSERPETYVVPVLFGILFLIGVTGNGCLIYILCRYKAMRSVPNTFIFNLALGDLLVLLCSVPFTATVYTFESWPYGEFVCKASEFAKDTSVGVSVFTLTALSLDRYTAIVRPVQSFVGGPKSKQVVVALAVIWTVSLALAMPAALFSHLLYETGPPIPDDEKQLDANGTLIGPSNRIIVICYPFPVELGSMYPKIVVLLRALLHYILPLVIIGTFYVIMAHHLLRSVQTIPGQATLTSQASIRHRNHPDSSLKMESAIVQQPQPTQQPHQNRTRRKVAKMVLSFVVLFAICFLPTHVFMLWFYFHPDSRDQYDSYWHALKIAGFVLAYINSCVNPIALYCVSTSFRKHFNRLLCCGSACAAGNASGSLASARFVDEPLSSGVSQSNQRATRSFKLTSHGLNNGAGRRGVEEEVPLSEFVRP